MENTEEPGWDKFMTKQLVDLGIEWNKARIIVGLVSGETITYDGTADNAIDEEDVRTAIGNLREQLY